MKNNRLFVAAMAFTLAALPVSGCSSGQGADSAVSAVESSAPAAVRSELSSREAAETVTLNLWGAIQIEKGVGAILDRFMADNADVKVEYTMFTNDDAGNAKLDTALLSGEPIDVYFTYSQATLVNRVHGGMAADLSEVGGDRFIEERIGTEGVFKVDDRFYSVPTAREPTCMMLNKDAFDRAGIPIPTEWTIDEFRETAKKLNDPENGMYGAYPIFYNTLIPLSTTILGNNSIYKPDGSASNYDDPAFQYDRLSYDLLFTDQCAFPYEEIISKQVSGQWNRLFASGKIAIAVFQPWMANTIRSLEDYPHDFVTAFAPMPVPEKGTDVYNIGSLNNFLMINSASEHREQDWRFIEYWLTTGAAEMLPYGKIPVVKDFADPDMAAKILKDPDGKLFDQSSFETAALDPNMKFVCNTITTAAGEIEQISKEEMDSLLLGQTSFEEYLANMKTRCDEAIRQAG